MTVHSPVFLRLWDPVGGSTVFAVQDFYHSTITVSSVNYQFLDFSVSGLATMASADANDVTVSLPALTTAVETAARGTGQLLASVTVYHFEADTAPDTPPGGQTTLVQFVGMLSSWALPNFDSELTLTIGSPLSPIVAQFPPRRYSSAIVGTPCRL